MSHYQGRWSALAVWPPTEKYRPLTNGEVKVVPPPGSFAPWQVMAGILTLILVLGAALWLAAINPLAVSGLVLVLGGLRKLLPKLLQVGTGDDK